MATKTERLNLRLTPAQDTVLRAAADAHGENASGYVLRNAVEAAQSDLADRRMFVVDEPVWLELQAALSSPVSVPLPMLKLLSNASVIEN
ncbi:MAG: type II toxin-antitoxin system TacA family antitoxin [Acidimicrobiales bacterium]